MGGEGRCFPDARFSVVFPPLNQLRSITDASGRVCAKRIRAEASVVVIF
jgi:hypothetical protein